MRVSEATVEFKIQFTNFDANDVQIQKAIHAAFDLIVVNINEQTKVLEKFTGTRTRTGDMRVSEFKDADPKRIWT